MLFTAEEVFETIRMIEMENFDIRTVTLGISLSDCSHNSCEETAKRIYEKIVSKAQNLRAVVDEISDEYGIPIANCRLAVTPISYVASSCRTDSYLPIAYAMDRAAKELDINYIGGFSALVHKGIKTCDDILMNSIPETLEKTDTVCSSLSLASTRAGINMDAVLRMSEIIKETAFRTADRQGVGCAKLVVFCNITEDNPFIAGAMHGFGEGECTINMGVSGPGVVRSVLTRMEDADLGEIAEAIKKTSFKITRMGELVGREVSKRLGFDFGIVDLSLAPTPAPGDSVANILEEMGLEMCGTHGTTAALAMMIDAVKKGGAMASSYVGGLSGAFIPISEDEGMIRAVQRGALSLDKLEAMTSVCSVGLDMFAVPGDTPVETIAAIIADEMAIGMINNKTTAVRILPIPGGKEGGLVEYGGLLGSAPIMPVNRFSSSKFIRRGGRIPAPVNSLRN
ncbi:MAG: PFL family protein [Candidatus Eremiobacteraeota bacterium]|nr:PFL family protein [Candidatus Eremiobacteraeota bacterium]